jgi:hypothetical protein
MVNRFTLILKDTHGIIDDLTGEALMDMSNALFEAGCDDCSPGVSCGIISVPFDREADSLREAIVSAIQQVHQAGYKVERVEADDQHVFDEVNAQLASGSPVTA